MPRFARRLAWLQKVFPPAGGQQPQPTEYSQDIVLTHPSVPPSAEFGNIQNSMIQGLGSTADSGYVPSDKFWWVQACSMSHNIAAGAQNCYIDFVSRKGGTIPGDFENVVLATGNLANSGTLETYSIVAPYRFIVPPGGQITAHTDGSGGATAGPRLRWSYLELDMGQVVL